jgi:peptidoglycan/xylan/chitin deacetylase (PgdA/CDA1 family)/glycosyltransferase involved in cell wall biosynthesis
LSTAVLNTGCRRGLLETVRGKATAQRMRFTIITNVFPSPWLPTKGTFNLELARELARHHEVSAIVPIPWVDELKHWVSRRGNSPQERTSVSDGIVTHFPRYYYPPKVCRGRYASFYWMSIRKAVLRQMQEQPPDAVLGYWAHPDGEVAIRCARRFGAAALVMVGGSDVLLLTAKSSRRRAIVDSLSQADAVITVSDHLRGRLIELGIQPDRVHVVYRGVDGSRFAPGDRGAARQGLGIPADSRVMLWVGRMVPVKGLDVLLEACRMLRSAGEKFTLYLVGDGPLRQQLAATVSTSGLSDCVRFAGSVQHHELAAWYRAADVTVLPSHSEGVPNVLLESHACGTLFVASNVGGIPEICVPGADRLVTPNDPQSLAAALADSLACKRPDAAQLCSRVSSLARAAEAVVGIVQNLHGMSPAKTAETSVRGPSHMLRRSQRPDAGRSDAIQTSTGSGKPSKLRQLARWGMAMTLPRPYFLVRGPAHSDRVCLTFDDGPHPEHTPRLLDVLKDHDVCATFFLVGCYAEAYPELVRRIIDEGHAVGNHTYTHADPQTISSRALLQEVRRTHEALRRIAGCSTSLFRPPHGKLSAGKLLSLWSARQSIVLWNVDPKDFQQASSAELRQWFSDRPLHAGDVVLLHDNHPHAAELLPNLIHETRRQGLAFERVSAWTGRQPINNSELLCVR